MPKGVFAIAGYWVAINLIAFILHGYEGVVVATYSCAAIVWFSRNKLAKLFNI